VPEDKEAMMDANDFRTMGECDFGTVWQVESEGKVVVNAYQAALYFSIPDFFKFAKMISTAAQNLSGGGATVPQPPRETKPASSNIADIRQFRPRREDE
jgi:hypothetical protein